MRKVLVVLLAMTMIIAVASPALAKYVTNSKTTSVVVEGNWWSGNWGDETISSGYAYAYQAIGAREGWIDFYTSVGTQVTCGNGTSDPADDYSGYNWTDTSGWGPATVSLAKSYAHGSATGTVETYTYSYNDCDWYAEPENGNGNGDPAFKEVSIDMYRISPLIKETNGYSFHIPGLYNDHAKYQSTYRDAQGKVTVDGLENQTHWGRIGKFTETYHSNGK